METRTLQLPVGIEKCSSPIGDGNDHRWIFNGIFESIEKCSSPIGDGNSGTTFSAVHGCIIEKCSSPIGDGNKLAGLYTAPLSVSLRNVAPR